jgi:hypothetical protein
VSRVRQVLGLDEIRLEVIPLTFVLTGLLMAGVGLCLLVF